MINVSKQNGFALISALVVLAIVTGATVAMVVKQTNGVELATNIIRYNQASNHADGIYLWAEGVLADDVKENIADSLQDNWNQRLVDVEIEGGQIDARIIDLQSKFNINNLGLSGSSGDLARERFRRLLYILNITTDFTDAVADWIDADSETRFPNGAEDEFYLSREENTYRTANQAFSDINELLLVKGVSQVSFEKLQPYISALEIGVGVNINTASEVVLSSLSNQMDRSAVQEFRQVRQDNVITELGSSGSNEDDDMNSGNEVDNRTSSSLRAPFNEVLTGDPACDAIIEKHYNKDNACRNVTQVNEQYDKQCLNSLSIVRDDCLGFAPPTTTGGTNGTAGTDLSSTGFLSKYNLSSTGLDVSSSFYNVIGKVQYFDKQYIVNYRLKRSSAGKIELMSKKINGIKSVEEDEKKELF